MWGYSAANIALAVVDLMHFMKWGGGKFHQFLPVCDQHLDDQPCYMEPVQKTPECK